ncbi:MAG TPA: hypothetical protein VNJ01_17800 [Bacteriovoracaceae bacterium]|nr:hypothetical protein [Bacteriovoracaceae bacterium]
MKTSLFLFLSLSLTSLPSFATSLKKYECIIEDSCPRNHYCLINGFFVTVENNQVVQVEDRQAGRFETISFTFNKDNNNTLSIVGTYDHESFFAQLRLKSSGLKNGIYLDVNGNRDKLSCELAD